MQLVNLRCGTANETLLTDQEKETLGREVPSWSANGKTLKREFPFNNFEEVMHFVNSVALLAQQENHHPDMSFSYKKATVVLSTHKAGGLTMNDFIMAAKIDSVLPDIPSLPKKNALPAAAISRSVRTDRIFIQDLAARCIIGVNDDERREKQDVSVSLSLYADLRPAATNDGLENAIDYRALKKKVLALTEESKFFLVEALAEAIAAVCLADPRIEKTVVRVEKPSALRFARSVGVEITRDRMG